METLKKVVEYTVIPLFVAAYYLFVGWGFSPSDASPTRIVYTAMLFVGMTIAIVLLAWAINRAQRKYLKDEEKEEKE